MGLLGGLIRSRVSRGVLAGSPFWIAVGAVMVGRRLLRLVAPKTETVYRQRLRPGESLAIHHLPDGR